MPDAAFHGVFPHLVSPVNPSGEVMDEVLNRLCNDLIAAGVHGLAALGSTGEFAYLRRVQRRRIVEVVVNADQRQLTYQCYCAALVLKADALNPIGRARLSPKGDIPQNRAVVAAERFLATRGMLRAAAA